MPLTVTSVAAWIAVLPEVGDEITTVQEPVSPAVVQLLGPTKLAVAPAELASENVITVPFEALTKPAPEPASTLTWPVRVWLVLTGLVASCGVIWMLASTKVLIASPLLGATPSVATVKDADPL